MFVAVVDQRDAVPDILRGNRFPAGSQRKQPVQHFFGLRDGFGIVAGDAQFRFPVHDPDGVSLFNQFDVFIEAAENVCDVVEPLNGQRSFVHIVKNPFMAGRKSRNPIPENMAAAVQCLRGIPR